MALKGDWRRIDGVVITDMSGNTIAIARLITSIRNDSSWEFHILALIYGLKLHKLLINYGSLFHKF